MLQELVERLVAQHCVALALLHGEIQVAFEEAAAALAARFPDLRQVHGGVFSGHLRAVLLAMNGVDRLTRRGESTRKVPEGASCGPQSTLRMSMGLNSSVRLGDPSMMWTRVRKLTPQIVETLASLTPQPMPAPKAGAQMTLDAGQQDRVFGPEGIGEQYELVLYWWPRADLSGVENAILAAVADLGVSGEERILAFAPLPAAVRPERVSDVDTGEDYEPAGDYEQFLPKKSSDTGDPGA